MNIFTCKQRPGIATRPPSISECPYSYRNAFLLPDECNIPIWKAQVNTTSLPTTHFEFQPFSLLPALQMPSAPSNDALLLPSHNNCSSYKWCLMWIRSQTHFYSLANKCKQTLHASFSQHCWRNSSSLQDTGKAQNWRQEPLKPSAFSQHHTESKSWDCPTLFQLSVLESWICTQLFNSVLSWKENCSITKWLFTNHLFHYS